MKQEIERLEAFRAQDKEIFIGVVQKFIESLEYEKIIEKREELKMRRQHETFAILDRFLAQHDMVIYLILVFC